MDFNGTNDKVKVNTINGKCSNCGECCAEYIPWTQAEVDTVKEYLKQHPEIKQQVHVEDNNLYMLCAFRDRKNKKCLIYPVRPSICRSFQCDMDRYIMQGNRAHAHLEADYNKMDENFDLKRFASSDLLFFDDMKYDIQYVYTMTGSEEATAVFLEEMDAVVLDKMPKK